MKKIFLFFGILLAAFVIVGCSSGQTSEAILGMEITAEDDAHTIFVGEQLQLTAQIYPSSLSQKFKWSSSNTDVAKVNEEGMVTAIREGKVEITATYTIVPKVTQKYLLIVEEEVVEIVPTRITVSAKNEITSCKVGESIRLTANVYPENASQKVTWVSSDESVATVTRGVVRPLKEGEVTITVYPNGYEELATSIILTFEKGDDPIFSNNWEEMEYTTHEQYMECADETPIKVKGVVTHINPISKDKVSYFVQDGESGYYIYSQDNLAMPVELGKVYEIGGFKKTYRGLSEIMNVEYFVELDDEVNFVVNDITGLDVSKQSVMSAYQCSFITGTAVLNSVSVSTKAYNFTATVNGVTATFRVDPSYADETEFAAINALLQIVGSGAEFNFTGIVIANSTGEITPQILIVKEADLDFGEISDEQLLDAASSKLEIVPTVGFSVDAIELPTVIEGFDDIYVSWESDLDLIDPANGKVTHGATDTVVTLTATIYLNSSITTKEFKVLVEAKDEKVYETLVSLDLEDALPANSWGNSETKGSYAEGNVILGTPKCTWMLRNALIACATNDKYNGTLAIRAQAQDSASSTGRIEILESGEYNIVEFAACIYGNDALGAKIRIEYTFDNGETWEASENVITLNNTVLETFRVKLPAGVKRVAIVVVEGSGRRVNLDDIKLMK